MKIYELIVQAVTQYRNFIGYSMQSNNYIKTVIFIRAMASVLPQDANYTVPNLPTREQGEPEVKYNLRLLLWINETLPTVEKTISQYVDYIARKYSNQL